MPRGTHIDQDERETILQIYALTGNAAQTAKQLKRSYGAVLNILKEAKEAGRDLKEARAHGANALASKSHVKAEQILDSITPDDLDSGYFEIEDSDGKVVGRKYWGPTLMQKATAFGIITDKANILQNYAKALDTDHQSGDLMLPGDIPTLIGAVQNKIKELSILNVRFKDENLDLVRRTEEVVAEVQAIQDVEYESFNGFDG